MTAAAPGPRLPEPDEDSLQCWHCGGEDRSCDACAWMEARALGRMLAFVLAWLFLLALAAICTVAAVVG